MKENKVPKSNRVDQIKQSREQQELPARCINSRDPTAQHCQCLQAENELALKK